MFRHPRDSLQRSRHQPPVRGPLAIALLVAIVIALTLALFI